MVDAGSGDSGRDCIKVAIAVSLVSKQWEDHKRNNKGQEMDRGTLDKKLDLATGNPDEFLAAYFKGANDGEELGMLPRAMSDVGMPLLQVS